MTEQKELKSWWGERYPMHSCPHCGLEHVRIPNLILPMHVQGQSLQVALVPYEVVGLVEGYARPGATPGSALDRPAWVTGLFWGPPGSPKAHQWSVLYAN